MKKGLLYFTEIMDLYSRKILSWGISNSINIIWCKNVLENPTIKYGDPQINNSNQGSQYTSAMWINYLKI